MVRLILLLLGVDYLRRRARALIWIGAIFFAFGLALVVDALDGVVHFPIKVFAWLLLLEGLATLAIVGIGVGGQRIVRALKGGTFTIAALLVLFFHQYNGNFWLSMLFGTLFLADGLLQCVAAHVVRYPRWKWAVGGGVLEIAVAIFFYQPYPTHYAGTLPYAIGLGLMFTGWNVLVLAMRARRMRGDFRIEQILGSPQEKRRLWRQRPGAPRWNGPPTDTEPALTVHVWTPSGSAKAPARRHPVIDRYIAAVDKNGVISTGHAALESHEGVYVSLYPAQEIDRSPDQFGQLLRATRENDVPGTFQPNYATESQAWCPSTVKVRIRNYSPQQLAVFWQAYQQNPTYNLTHRNCSSSVAKALEAAIEGRVGKLQNGEDAGWWTFVRLWLTPELWVAAQLRKRAKTMAWTPGLVLDYARAVSMLVDPRPFGWITMSSLAMRRMRRSRRAWREAEQQAAAQQLHDNTVPDAPKH
ncbi:HdeD family acid-resistance protein [Pandoraea sp. NPDC087047]|uniref:HdeD family acid-resistance protein n=1 Tax=Pandoraea sp. NPDC087047 TaxID=3364390 RepID=UPI0038012BCE